MDETSNEFLAVKKPRKRIMIPIIILVSIVVLAGIGLLVINVIRGIYKFDYVDSGTSVVIEGQDRQALADAGYHVSYPNFCYANTEAHTKINRAIHDGYMDYIHDIVNEYKNYAKLDYTVDLKEGETLTISFTGNGYPDEGEGEPVKLDKAFVYDISNLSGENPPRLIETK